MPRIIDCPQEDRVDLADVVGHLEGLDFDVRDEDAFAELGPLLKRLGNNKTFLTDIMIAELKERCADQVTDNEYSAQVIMLHKGRNFFMRANFWPAMKDSIVRQSGTDPFFYGVPHDHNFSFLTVGYFGPGYWSDYYEYDYQDVVGYPGEKVKLRFIEKARLELGKVMLYRAHRDIHLQLPADELSMSINIIPQTPAAAFSDQYRFNLDNSTVAGFLHRASLEPLLALAAYYGGGEGMDLISDYAVRHPSDRMRWSALRALAGAAPTLEGRLAVLEDGTRSESRLVSAMAAQEIARLEAGRAWILQRPEAA